MEIKQQFSEELKKAKAENNVKSNSGQIDEEKYKK